MIDKEVRMSVYELFYKNKNFSLIDMLNNSSCDEILEVDMKNNSYKQIYHYEGKYFVPEFNLSYSNIYLFTLEHGIHPDDKEVYKSLMNPEGFLERIKHNRVPNFDFAHFRYKLQNGGYRYVEQCVIAGEENGIPEGLFRIYIFDINNLMIRQLGLVSTNNDNEVVITSRDRITGLLTDKVFIDYANRIVNEQNDKQWCIISIDIEHFKFFDEWCGREAGDFLLAKIGAALLESEEKAGGVSGYFGQDDFIVLVPYDMKLIKALYDNIKNVIISYGSSVGFAPAFGVAIIEKGMNVIDVFDRASIASSKAKEDIRKRIYVYNQEMRFESEKEFRILNDYMNAFKNDEITFYLQPQCRISNGKIVGAESLARWIKKDGTIVPPDQYIPILEKYGFITDLDQRLWEKVCIWLRSWIDKGHKPVPISLNVSRADIFNIDIAKHFVKLTKKYNIPHELIKLEITESAYTETTGMMVELVDKLRNEGFPILMDDFGSGYSSLNMLSSLNVDAIKLDARFLNIEDKDKHKGVHILESVVNMSKQIALPIIVEGVENQKQSDFLEEMGCRYVQGFHFYRPMPVSKFEDIISYPNKIDHRGFVVKLNEQFRIREFLDKNIYSDSMLNNVLGAVAIYSWKGEHVDIIRFNQQFYEAVNVPDFQERLVNIEQFLPEEDKPKMLKVLQEAVDNKYNGASEVLRFYRTNGSLSSFMIHFYYLGNKDGREQFYGAAKDITELADLVDERSLIIKYSLDNLIFVKKIENKWVYSVVSHQLSDELKISPKELEEEMNDGRFAKRVVNQEDLKAFMKQKHKDKEFTVDFMIKDNNNKIRKLHLLFINVENENNNVDYVLRTSIID